MLNAAGGMLAIEFGLRGPNYTVATACASATNAMGGALRDIQSGTADVIITGGTEAALTRMGLSAFQNIRALSSQRDDDPARASRPFDADRDGFVLGRRCWPAGVRGLRACQGTRCSNLLRSARLWCPAPMPVTSLNPTKAVPAQLRPCPTRCVIAELNAAANRLHQRPWDEHAAGGQSRDAGREEGLRRGGPATSAFPAPRASWDIFWVPAAVLNLC